MDPVTTGLVAGGSLVGSALDYFGSQRAQRRQERILNEIRGISDKNLASNADGFAKAFPHLSAAVDTVRQAGERALRANTASGATASRMVGDQVARAQRETRASLVQRGLGSTTRLAGAAGEIARRGGEALGSIGERTGAVNAGIISGTGDRVAAGQTTLAGSYLDKASRDISIRNSLASQLGGVQYEAQGGSASALGQLGGMLGLLRESWGTGGKDTGSTNPFVAK